MLLVLLSREYIIPLLIILVIAVCIPLILFLKNKKEKTYIASIVDKLIQEDMVDVKCNKDKKLYNISFKYNNKNFFLRIHQGNKRKGFIMTNPSTIHEVTYKSEYGSAKKSEYAQSLTPFLTESLKGIKIILVKNNMLRITKYINENEIEEVRYNEPSFNVYIVQEKDLNNFIELIKKKRK